MNHPEGNPQVLSTIRWGIIGCGDVTEVKSGPGFQKATGSQLVAVMRRNGALAEDYARRHGVPRWYADADALIHDPDVDAVYIATPPSSHKDYALRCAAAGKPAYVEKPMAMNLSECDEMVSAFAAASVPLFVAYYRRAMPRFVKLRELIAAGAIGTPRFFTVLLHRPVQARDADAAQNWRIDPAVAGGGYFVDMAAHQLDLLDWLFGPVEAAGHAGNQAQLYAVEDIVSASFRCASGVQGTGLWCFSAMDARDEMCFVGDAGRIALACFDETPIRLETSEGTQHFEISNPAHVQQPMIQNVVDCLRGQAVALSTGDSAARTTRLIDSLLA